MIYLFALSLDVKQFYLTYQALPLQVRVDLGAMTMKGYTAFPKTPELELHYQIFFFSFVGVGGVYSSAEIQSVYFTVLVNWARIMKGYSTFPKLQNWNLISRYSSMPYTGR